MFAIVKLTYAVPLDEVLRHVDDHRGYCAELYRAGKLIASGPLVPRTGGVLLMHTADKAELERLVAGDPFHVRQIANYEIMEWAPVLGAEGLTSLASPAPPSRT